MKAATCKGFGPQSSLTLADYPKPRMGSNDVMVEVYASSVNPKDWKLNTTINKLIPTLGDTIHPLVLGDDLAGVVVDKGSNVSRFNVGDEVYGMTMHLRTGALAEFAAIDQDCIALKPSNISFSEAASVPLAGLTALQALRLAEVKEGSKVLIIGASGGVGTFAVQIAKALGAEVTGVCSGRNLQLVESLGADNVIDYTQENFTDRDDSFDAVFDATSYNSLAKCSSLMTENGIFVSTLGHGKAIVDFALAQITHHKQKAKAVRVTPNTRDLETLCEYIEQGKVKPQIDSQYDLDEFEKAYERSQTGHAAGKIVINIKTAARAERPVAAA
ncbi:MAG: NAD(P)-dependent alcohol dehydrogenase [Ketobacteraceae bacterium]|nr:NAD(P)-dependent alcohol dehydrogenase [Ketobacteraceae bacterium]